MSQMTSTARVGVRALNRPATTTPRLRVVTGAPVRSGGAAFGILCATLLAAGLAGLLVLNTALAQGSFTLHDLRATSDQLADEQGVLSQSLERSKSPGNLATRATSMGMVPAGSAAFLRLSDGKVIGVARPATAGSGFTVVRTTASAPAATVGKPAKRAPAAPVAKPAKAASASSAQGPVTSASDADRVAKPVER